MVGPSVLRSVLIVSILAAGIVGGTMQTASVFAHATLLRADPPVGKTVTSAPKVVRAWFNEELDSKRSALSVWNARGQRVDDGKGGVDLNDMDRKSMLARLKPVGPGTYTVKWIAVSADDQFVAKGSFRFVVAAPKRTGRMAPAPIASLRPRFMP